MLLLHRPPSLRIRLDQRPLRTMAELVAKRRRTDSPVQGLQSHSSEVICSHESSHQVKVQGGLICTDHFFSTQLDYTGEVSYETTISTDHHQEAIRGYGTQLMSLHASLPSLSLTEIRPTGDIRSRSHCLQQEGPRVEPPMHLLSRWWPWLSLPSPLRMPRLDQNRHLPVPCHPPRSKGHRSKQPHHNQQPGQQRRA